MKSFSLIALLLYLLVILTYAPVINFEFINFDDNYYVTENSHVNQGLSKDGIIWAFSEPSEGHWHPLTWLSHMLDVELFGLDPGAHHAVNVLFHALNAVLVFLLLVLLTKAWGESLFVAAIFALHPMRLESVAWVAERKDVLSLFFGLLALIAYCGFVRHRTLFRYLLIATLFIFSLLSKPTLVTLPILFLLLDYWPLNRIVAADSFRGFLKLNKRLLLEKIPLLFLSAAMSLIAVRSQAAGGGLRETAPNALLENLQNAIVSYAIYFEKLFWPQDLAIFYPMRSHSIETVTISGLFLLFLSGLFLFRRQSRYLAVGWLWFVVALLPMVGIIRIGGQAYADRWSYLPHIGLIVAITWFVSEKVKGKQPRKLLAIMGLVIVVVSISYTRVILPTWASSETVFRHALSIDSENFMAHNNLGFALERNNPHEALFHYREAVRLNPTYPEALNNLGSMLAQGGKIKEAVPFFERALARKPNYLVANYNLGLSYSYLGDNISALIYFLRALRIDPGYEKARQSIQFVLSRRADEICSPTTANNYRLLNLKQEISQIDSGEKVYPLYQEITARLRCLK